VNIWAGVSFPKKQGQYEIEILAYKISQGESQMKGSRFSAEQIIGILKQQEAGKTVAALCRERGVSEATFSKWKSRYGGATVALQWRYGGATVA
jgi:putative transposase